MATFFQIVVLLVAGVLAHQLAKPFRGRWILRDNEGTQLVTERLLEPAFCLRAGERFDADAPILPELQAA